MEALLNAASASDSRREKDIEAMKEIKKRLDKYLSDAKSAGTVIKYLIKVAASGIIEDIIVEASCCATALIVGDDVARIVCTTGAEKDLSEECWDRSLHQAVASRDIIYGRELLDYYEF